MNLVDPRGLVEWNGQAKYVSSSFVFGIVRATFLVSKCVGGIRVIVKAKGTGVFVGKGLWTATASIGFSTLLGYSYSGISAGSAFSSGGVLQTGVEILGVSFVSGSSRVVFSKIKECDSCDSR